MPTSLLAEILKLSVSERIHLAQEIWDSVAAEVGALPLEEGDRKELDRRLADVQANPGAGKPWSDVRERLLRRP